MKTFDITDMEEAAAESEQDRQDHRQLAKNVNELTKREDAMRIPVATQKLVDAGVDPVVIAKTLLIGDRPGGTMYQLSSRSMALSQDEGAAENMLQLAILEMDVDLAATFMVAGAVWLATQFSLDKAILAEMVIHAARRPRRATRAGYGVVDFVDSHGVGKRADIITAIDLAQLPNFAPLEYRPG